MITKSVCPVCLKEIDAELAVGAHVWMVKECPDHGRFAAMVERDPAWFFLTKKLNCPSFYDGLMVDVTGRCNIACKYCYHGKDGGDRNQSDILAEIMYYGDKHPFILTGGEPTLHPEIITIINESLRVGPTVMLTNGIKMANKKFLDSICETGLLQDGLLSVGLSFHPESRGKDMAFVAACRKRKIKIATSFYVIDSVDQINDAIALLITNQDVLGEMRIKAASNLWNEAGASNKIFVSDMLKKVLEIDDYEFDYTCNNKLSYANIIFNDMKIKLISWYDKHNVDLNDINCAPWYLAKNGTLNNLVTTGILNECR